MSKHFGLKLLFFIFLISVGNSSLAQIKMLKKLLSSEPDTSRSNKFLAVPLLGYTKETGFEFGISGLYSFYTDRHDKTNRSSVLSGDATHSTQQQTTFLLETDIWTSKNKYHYSGRIRYKIFPFYFYGIGDQTLEMDKDLILQKLYYVMFEAEKKINKIYYVGLNSSFERYVFSDRDDVGIFTNIPLNGREGGKAVFVGVSQSIDTRNSHVYSTKGIYLKLNYSYCPNFFGGENFEGSFIKFDFRSFKSFNDKLVLGVNANYQTIQASSIPFYLLPQMGNEKIMRGYYAGRYRDQNLLAAQVELRYRFHPRFGIVGFAGVGSTYSNGNFRLTGSKPSFGGGLRYFFNIEQGLSLSLDYGIGEKRPNESRQYNLYVSIGQSF